jgi:hypothetical protein
MNIIFARRCVRLCLRWSSRLSRTVAAVHEIPGHDRLSRSAHGLRRGSGRADRGDGAQANDLYRTAVAADPDFTYAWINLSNVSFSTEEFNGSAARARSGARRKAE